jgi:palmitoyltransferase
VTVSKHQSRIKHLSTENDEHDEKYEKNLEKKENSEKNKKKSETAEINDEPVLIETRFCTVCCLEQPLRAKHCRECGKCVALHDHHCPWLGICIGEKNRFYFWWYLLFECALLWISAVVLVLSFESRIGLSWILSNLVRVLLLVVVGFFVVMVTCLLGYHTFLAMANQTTWENVSWEKISYLKQKAKSEGSPFSKGLRFNLWFYCCKKLPDGYTLWIITRSEVDSVV